LLGKVNNFIISIRKIWLDHIFLALGLFFSYSVYIYTMAFKKQKFYVVWEGRKTGIFTTWEECKEATMGHQGAKYKAFESLDEAMTASKSNPWKYMNQKEKSISQSTMPGNIIYPSVSVDAACAGVPGPMEYQGVDSRTKQLLFHQGPFPNGTNNIGEFLAIVHALAMLDKLGNKQMPIYTDSVTAMAWVRNKKAKTTHTMEANNEVLFDMIDRAEKWLKDHSILNPIFKWETKKWGEIPADFGRK
jgi:ribonuclease HI